MVPTKGIFFHYGQKLKVVVNHTPQNENDILKLEADLRKRRKGWKLWARQLKKGRPVTDSRWNGSAAYLLVYTNMSGFKADAQTLQTSKRQSASVWWTSPNASHEDCFHLLDGERSPQVF